MALVVTNLPAKAGDLRCEFSPWVGKILCRKEWQLTPVFLPGEIHGQGSLKGYSPWGTEESDTTERLTHTHLRIVMYRIKISKVNYKYADF